LAESKEVGLVCDLEAAEKPEPPYPETHVKLGVAGHLGQQFADDAQVVAHAGDARAATLYEGTAKVCVNARLLP